MLLCTSTTMLFFWQGLWITTRVLLVWLAPRFVLLMTP
jgi:hypothetical protein